MSSSDSRMFEDLVARVERLEQRVSAMAESIGPLAEQVLAKDVSGDLYGAEADHTADRAERAEISRRVPRPPGGAR